MLLLADLVETSLYPSHRLPDDHKLRRLELEAPTDYNRLLEIIKSADFAYVAPWTSFGMQALHGSIHSYTQSLPGAGKTTFISMVSIAGPIQRTGGISRT